TRSCRSVPARTRRRTSGRRASRSHRDRYSGAATIAPPRAGRPHRRPYSSPRRAFERRNRTRGSSATRVPRARELSWEPPASPHRIAARRRLGREPRDPSRIRVHRIGGGGKEKAARVPLHESRGSRPRLASTAHRPKALDGQRLALLDERAARIPLRASAERFHCGISIPTRERGWRRVEEAALRRESGAATHLGCSRVAAPRRGVGSAGLSSSLGRGWGGGGGGGDPGAAPPPAGGAAATIAGAWPARSTCHPARPPAPMATQRRKQPSPSQLREPSPWSCGIGRTSGGGAGGFAAASGGSTRAAPWGGGPA